MSGKFRNCMLLLGALTISLVAQAQQPVKSDAKMSADIAITYTAERAKIAGIDCGCFWLQGGGVDGAITFYHGLGIAANLTGVHASNVNPGVDLDKVSFMMGPRYTYRPEHWKNRLFGQNHGIGVFGEGLVGGMHGFNTVFPSSSGVQGAASSFAFQVGGGMDWTVKKNIGIRVVEADYVRSTLPNNASNVQNDLRLAGGVSFHFKY
jgi:hypothetical protein